MKEISFSKQAEEHQLTWRTGNIETKDKGEQNGISKDHILPSDLWLLGVWEPVREPLKRYIEVEGIQAHQGKHNLKSSWVQCANTFFPFRLNHSMQYMLTSFIKRELRLDISTIDSVDLEYAGSGKLSPKHLLGEKDGRRGSGQTSPDVAIQFSCDDGKCGIYLIENKYTEDHFYECSAAKKTLDKAHSARGLQPNPDPKRCQDTAGLIKSPDTMCHQAFWGRRYWSTLDKHLNEGAWQNLPYCPAMNDGYQLFRQQALAQGMAESSLFDYVISGVAYDERNKELCGCLRDLGIKDFREGWPTLFKSNSGVKFHCFSHQRIVAWVERSRNTFIKGWAKYLYERYGF